VGDEPPSKGTGIQLEGTALPEPLASPPPVPSIDAPVIDAPVVDAPVVQAPVVDGVSLTMPTAPLGL